MKKKNKSLIKNIGLFTIGSFGSKILSFLLLPLYTAILASKEYGLVDITTSTAYLLMPILLLSIFDATLRFGMDKNYKKEDVITTSINVALIGSFILVVLTIIIAIFKPFNISNEYLIFLDVIFILGSFNQIFNLYLKAKNQVSVIVVGGILCTLVTGLLNIFLLLYLKAGIIGYMVGNTVGILIQDLYQVFVGKIYKDITFNNYNNLSKPMLKYSIPLIANSISWWINNVSDRYIVTFIKGVASNGIYSVSYKIPTILTMFQNIFYNAWSISAISEFNKEDVDGFIGTNYTLYSYISMLICSILLVFNIPLARFMYRGEYFVAWKCVPFLLIGTVYSGISQFEGSLFAATKKTKLVAKTTIIGAIVNTILNIILIYYIGIIGAAIATFIGYFIVWGLRTISLQRFVSMKVNWKIHFFSLIFLTIQTILATIDKYFMVQIALLIILIVLNIKNITPIINVIRTKKQ